jgi:hypothetical protein
MSVIAVTPRSVVPAWLVGVLLLAGCGRGLNIHTITYHDTIIRQYDPPDDPDATIVISKSGTFYRKWRVTSEGAWTLYQVDVNARICLAVRLVVPRENVKRDADLRQFIDW